MRKYASPHALLACSVALCAPVARAHEQDAPPPAPSNAAPASAPAWSSRSCFAPARLTRQAEFERTLLAAPAESSLRASHDILAADPHVAGTPGGLRGAERLAARFREFGLAVELPEYSVLLPMARDAELAIVAPDTLPLPVRERPLPEDPFTTAPQQPGAPELALGWNGYSASAEAVGQVVYANYGTKQDFDALKIAGVSCEGKIVIARYGGNFRGYKAKFAQEAGAAAILIYTDPADSGYAQGAVYPEGVWGNDSYIQRGSIDTLPYDGDPLTPGVPSLPGAPRLDPDAIALPRIPVQPIGYAAALEIMRRMTGPTVHSATARTDAPVEAGAPLPSKSWQGGLPVPYRLTGGDALRVRVRVDQPREQRPIRNVIARIEGERFPEQTVIIGAHHDAWVCGADDPLSGTIVVAEAARAFAEAARQGFRPARTLLFCGWDAEEFGIIGSTEWVEENAASLSAGCVAYINLDAAVSGWNFGASGSPSLQALIREVAHDVPQPASPLDPAAPRTTIYDAWLVRAGARAADAPAPIEPPIGTMGGGSDHSAFLTHLGIPCASMGFGGAGGTAYHSMYDNLVWYRKMMRDDYSPHAALTRVVCLAAARLANADALPYERDAVPREALRHLKSIEERAARAALPFDAAELRAALEAASLASQATPPTVAAQMAAERAWLDPDGLPGRPWRRNLFVAPDETSGYASWPLPGLRRAVEQRDPAQLAEATTRLLRAVQRFRAALDPSTPAANPASQPAAIPVPTPGAGAGAGAK